MNNSRIIYTDNAPRPSTLLAKKLAQTNSALMRTKTIAEQREIKSKLAEVQSALFHHKTHTLLSDENNHSSAKPSRRFIYSVAKKHRKKQVNLTPPVYLSAVTIKKSDYSGVPCERIIPGNSAFDNKLILYFHGGSWIFGGLDTSRSFAVYMAELTKCPLLSVDYRLAPEHPYPAGLEDCFAVYSSLLNSGYSPKDIALLGDSAGGNLALCLLNKLKFLGLEQPACLCAASPVTDLTEESNIAKSKPDLIYTIYKGIERDIFSLYTNGADRSDPFVSPVQANLSGLAPILIHAGGDEALAEDNISFAQKAKETNADVQVKIFNDMFHDFTVIGRSLKESRQSSSEFAKFFVRYLNKTV